MSKNNEMDTKSKILNVANSLFARQGYDGVSIRDIAQEADVNIASVNYHFKNKLGLFHEIFTYNFDDVEDRISKIDPNEDLSIADFSEKLFNTFNEKGDSLVNTFKMLLTDHLAPQEQDEENVKLNPPGAEFLLNAISRELDDDFPIRAKEWAMRMLFTNIVHTSVMLNSRCLKSRIDGYWMNNEYKAFEIKHMAAALITYLKTNKGNWTDNS